MIQPATAQRPTSPATLSMAPQGAGAPGGFADSLAMVLDAAAVAIAPPTVAGTAAIATPAIGLVEPGRQVVADPGKALPVDSPALFPVIGIAAPVAVDGTSPTPIDALAPATPPLTEPTPIRADAIVLAARGTSALTPLPTRPAPSKIADAKGNVSTERGVTNTNLASVAPPMPGPAPLLTAQPAGSGDGQNADSDHDPEAPQAGATTDVPPAIVAMPTPQSTPIHNQTVESGEGIGDIGRRADAPVPARGGNGPAAPPAVPTLMQAHQAAPMPRVAGAPIDTTTPRANAQRPAPTVEAGESIGNIAGVGAPVPARVDLGPVALPAAAAIMPADQVVPIPIPAGAPIDTTTPRIQTQRPAPMVAAGAPMLQVAAAIMAAMPTAAPPTGTVETLPARDLPPLPAAPASVVGSVPVEAPVPTVAPTVAPVVAPILATPTPVTATLPLMATTGAMPAFVAMQPVDAPASPVPTPSLPMPSLATADSAPRWTPPATIAAQPLVAQQVAAQFQPQPGTVASAAQVFGAAIQAATRRRDEPASPTDIGALGPVAAPLTTHAVTQLADAQQAPLDMRQERWPHAMIERIDTLRDAANATDTRIRLIPDALGTIDVSVKRDGDTVRVHFNAEQAQTRTLLQDAQPRLAELAEARGIKLTQTGVAGSGGDAGPNAGTSQQRQSNTPPPHMPTAPARARAAATDSTDSRLA